MDAVDSLRDVMKVNNDISCTKTLPRQGVVIFIKKRRWLLLSGETMSHHIKWKITYTLKKMANILLI